MSSENFWDLFTETGDIGFYLLYLESAGKKSPREIHESTRTDARR